MISEQKQIRTLLEERILQFQAWSDSSPRATGNLAIRKYPCRVELLDFRIAKNAQPRGQAKLKVVFSNQRQIWSTTMTMSLFTRTVRKVGYEDLKPGIYFHAFAKQGKPELIKSFKIIMTSAGAYEPADFNQWLYYWLQRVLKDPSIKILFAHKQLLSENELDAEFFGQ